MSHEKNVNALLLELFFGKTCEMACITIVGRQLARYWAYMTGLNTFQRLLWLVVMIVSALSLILINEFLFKGSMLGGYLFLLPLILIFTPVHISVVFPKRNRSKN